jgi:hypothetical protein
MGKRKVSVPEEDDWYKPEEPVVYHEVVPTDPDDLRRQVPRADGWVYVLPSKNANDRYKAAYTLQTFIRKKTKKISTVVDKSHSATRKM